MNIYTTYSEPYLIFVIFYTTAIEAKKFYTSA